MKVPFAAAFALLNVATLASAQDAPICTDRPAKANALCTVPAGNWQVESTLAGWSLTKAAGTRTKVLVLGSSLVKRGLSDRDDLEIGLTPYVRVDQDGSVSSGFGDAIVRYKRRLTRDDAPVQVALIPFVKLPTADSDIGNGKLEGGLAVPISIATGTPVSVVLGPEVDLLADADGSGHHLAAVNLINLSGPVADKLTLAGELWTMTNFDPAGTATSASADVALAYAIRSNVQIDAGANFGLNRNSVDREYYAGLGVRF